MAASAHWRSAMCILPPHSCMIPIIRGWGIADLMDNAFKYSCCMVYQEKMKSKLVIAVWLRFHCPQTKFTSIWGHTLYVTPSPSQSPHCTEDYTNNNEKETVLKENCSRLQLQSLHLNLLWQVSHSQSISQGHSVQTYKPSASCYFLFLYTSGFL